ncbi:uncharacterized protein RSE6_01140 [Rhynchosporium secalis]|uniref:Uncharacterized protein n=1 Tax=Rhynchosporium secalis TaxID=38038 RepID=A0A1E1LYP5_RHYSE|nr:uncharacterized protein RSE6_01140 [Rhynchosporium secalis]
MAFSYCSMSEVTSSMRSSHIQQSGCLGKGGKHKDFEGHGRYLPYLSANNQYLESSFRFLAKPHSDKFTFGVAAEPKVAKSENVQFPVSCATE